MSDVNTQYNEYVKAVPSVLSKPGEAILAQLDPTKIRLFHVAAAALGEVVEFQEADPSDHANILEELGDIVFYIADYAQLLGIEVQHKTSTEIDDYYEALHKQSGEPVGLVEELTGAVNTIFNQTKKYSIHNKSVDLVAETSESVNKAFIAIKAIAEQILGLDIVDVLNHNTEKLLTGAKARYAKGTYSDEQAHTRADKDGADE